jgi:DNA polymerase III delta prime subunit
MMSLESRTGLDTNRLSHAYITEGTFANTIATAVVCSGRGGVRPCFTCAHCNKASRFIHPDITFLDKLPDKREILVDQVRELKQDVYIIPNEADKKAYIINNADSMNSNAQNAILQILEDPPAHAVFILSTNNPATLLPTVRSRCVEIKSGALSESFRSEDSDSTNDTVYAFLTSLVGSNVDLVDTMFHLEKLDRITFSVFLTSVREHLASLLRAEKLGGTGKQTVTTGKTKHKTLSNAERIALANAERKALSNAERVLVKAGEMLDLNVSIGHISGMICASLMTIND